MGGITPLHFMTTMLTAVLAWNPLLLYNPGFQLSVAAVATPGATLPLVGLFYLGCIPAAVAEATLPEERWSRAAGLLVVWAALWITLVAVL